MSASSSFDKEESSGHFPRVPEVIVRGEEAGEAKRTKRTLKVQEIYTG
jgi:hypothetical protein